MKYRVFALLGMMALSAGAILQAQDYDDIYYDGSQSTKKVVKTVKPAKTEAVYGTVPEKYKVAVQDNYRLERDVDEYNRRVQFEPELAYEVDINGDTIYFDNDSIYEEAFANTRRIERFYNPDIVILSDDDDLVELYYDESPTINLIVGTDWGLGSYYGWGSYYYPWYTGWYDPWYIGYGWYSPWRWHSPWYYGYHHWGYGYYHPWYYGYGDPYWRWGHYYGGSYYGYHGWDRPYHNYGRYTNNSLNLGGHRTGLASNRNTRGRVDAVSSNRNGISARSGNMGSRSSGVSSTGTRRSGYASSRSSGNMGSRRSSGVSTRGGVTRSSSSSYSGGRSSSRSSDGSSYSGGSRRSSGSSYSGSSRSSGSSYSGGSRSSGGSYSSGSSHGSSGGGSHGGSSGGGSRRH